MNLQFERASNRLGWPIGLTMLASILSLVVAYFPVRWLASSVASQTNCRVVLAQSEGSIWKGSAQLGFSDLSSGSSKDCHRPHSVSELVSWSTQCSVSAGYCKWMIQYPNTTRPLEVTVKPSSVTLTSNQIELPANLIEVLGGVWHSLHLRGRLTIRWEDFIWDSSPRGLVEVQFKNVTSPISPLKPLGSYALTFQPEQFSKLEVSTLKGPLLLTGKGTIERGQLSFQGEATAQPESMESLIGLLTIIGTKDGSLYRFKI